MKIVIMPLAAARYDEIEEYILVNFGYKVKEKFKTAFVEKLDQLLLFPKSGQVFSKEKAIYKAVLTLHNTIYYRLQNDLKIIEILFIFDTRQHPQKLQINL